MADPFTAVSIALTVVGSVVSAVGEAQQANSEAKAASRNAQAQIDEIQRQEIEVNKVAEEEKGDRARLADRELGELRVFASERGGLQTNSHIRNVQETGFFEGQDISRIEGNRSSHIQSLEAGKRAAKQGAQNAARQAVASSRNALIGGLLGGVQDGLQIKIRSDRRKDDLADAENPVR